MNTLKLHIDPPREADEPFPFPGRRQNKGIEHFTPRLVGDELPQWNGPSGRMGPGMFGVESELGKHCHGLHTHPALEALANVERHLATLSNLVDQDGDDRPRAA